MAAFSGTSVVLSLSIQQDAKYGYNNIQYFFEHFAGKVSNEEKEAVDSSLFVHS